MSKLDLRLGDNIFEAAKLATLDPAQAFSGEDLSGFNLSQYDLRNFNFRGTRLNGADLRNTRLNGAKLHYARLRGANLVNANLCGAELQDADLNGADLRGADLSGADLSRANVRDAQFGRSLGLTEEAKRDLKNRGATFKDSTSGEFSLSEQALKWLRYVIVPVTVALIGSGGIIAIITAVKSGSPSPTLVPISKPTTQVIP